jgi:hypothetical protein
MKVYGAVSSAEDSTPLLKRNTNKSFETSSHYFKRIAAATLLAGGALAVASKNTNYSSFAIGGGRNYLRVRGLGDALDDAKAGTLFYRFCALLEIKKNISSSRRISFQVALLPFADRKNTRRNETRSAKRRECLIVRRASIIEFLSFCIMRCSRARRREIQFSGFPWFCNTLLEFRVLVVK